MILVAKLLIGRNTTQVSSCSRGASNSTPTGMNNRPFTNIGRRPKLNVIGPSGAPARSQGVRITVDPSNSILSIDSGHYYVDGILCENEKKTTYDSQPDLPNAPSVLHVLQQARTNLGIVYLDVWKRHITFLDDSSLRESALSGPDTTTRVKTVWQVKVLPVKEPPSGIADCETSFEEWGRLVAPAPKTGALTARSRAATSVNNPCIIPASAGYRGLENQLYRVEIHKRGVLGDPNNVPTFKWSRDNGTVVTSIDKISGQEITVRDLGPDDALGFASGQWVEVFDDAAELNGQPGQLLQIDKTIRTSPPVIKLVSAARIRYPPRAVVSIQIATRNFDDGTAPENCRFRSRQRTMGSFLWKTVSKSNSKPGVTDRRALADSGTDCDQWRDRHG